MPQSISLLRDTYMILVSQDALSQGSKGKLTYLKQRDNISVLALVAYRKFSSHPSLLLIRDYVFE